MENRTISPPTSSGSVENPIVLDDDVEVSEEEEEPRLAWSRPASPFPRTLIPVEDEIVTEIDRAEDAFFHHVGLGWRRVAGSPVVPSSVAGEEEEELDEYMGVECLTFIRNRRISESGILMIPALWLSRKLYSTTWSPVMIQFRSMRGLLPMRLR